MIALIYCSRALCLSHPSCHLLGYQIQDSHWLLNIDGLMQKEMKLHALGWHIFHIKTSIGFTKNKSCHTCIWSMCLQRLHLQKKIHDTATLIWLQNQIQVKFLLCKMYTNKFLHDFFMCNHIICIWIFAVQNGYNLPEWLVLHLPSSLKLLSRQNPEA